MHPRTAFIIGLAALCFIAGRPAITPADILSTEDRGTSVLVVNDTTLLRIRSCFGARFFSVTITRCVVHPNGEWTIAGRVVDAVDSTSRDDVSIMLGRSPSDAPPSPARRNTPDAELYGTTIPAHAGELRPTHSPPPSARRLEPSVRVATRRDGTFALRGRVDAETCLVIVNGPRLVELYDVGRLVRK